MRSTRSLLSAFGIERPLVALHERPERVLIPAEASGHEGVVFGVHVYSTYSEWLDSPARKQGRHCQDCHMKPTGTMPTAMRCGRTT